MVDYLIIGSGIAGLSLALKAAGRGSVLIVTKDRLPESNSAYAQGGIASVWSAEDSFAAHMQDTLTAGLGSATPAWLRRWCGRGRTESSS